MNKETIQQKMLLEIKERSVFKKAQEYAFEYLKNVFERNVYPTNEAINNLKYFEEDLPEHSSNPNEILAQLHK